ncbi:hypothetical protein X759_20790 [Mesorhizobium sp. LSHC420B00]|nr:hypothetical protein X759_20790 [Mesorhizobium sp. LSHC420B00]
MGRLRAPLTFEELRASRRRSPKLAKLVGSEAEAPRADLTQRGSPT